MSLKFSNTSLSKKNERKVEMWWFADRFGYTPDQYRAMSFSDKEALKAVENGRNEYNKSIAEFQKAKRKLTGSQGRRPRVRRRPKRR